MSDLPSSAEQIAWDHTQFPTGWSGSEVTKDDFVYDLTPSHLQAIDELMEGIVRRGVPFDQINLADFSHPALDDDLRTVLTKLRQGNGLVLMRGLPVHKYSATLMQHVLWGLGTHFGTAVSQSSGGDVLGHVAVRDKNSSRGYTSDRQLDLHTDSAEIIALLCVRKSVEGGESVFASSLRIREIMRKERPHLLTILERGFPYHRRGEEAPGAEPITPYNVPVFSTKNGLISCRYVREIIEVALRDLNRPFTAEEHEALDFFDSVSQRAEVKFVHQLEPGEIAWMNNYQILHARTSFTDSESPEKTRLLYRLWLQDIPPRPMQKEVLVFQNASGRQGIDPQSGRRAGLPKYSTANH